MQLNHPNKLVKPSSTWPMVALTLVIFLFILRLLLPSMILQVANKRLENESPIFSFHVDSLHMDLLQGDYNLEGISGVYKDNGEPFLNIHIVSVSLPWREVFNRKFNTDLLVNRLNLEVSKKLVSKVEQEKKRIAKESPKNKKDFINLHKIQILESSVEIKDYLGSNPKEKNEIQDINLRIDNASPSGQDAISNFSLSASILGPAPLSLIGIAKPNKMPIEWDANLKLLDFKLKAFNPVVQENFKALIHKGNLDFYAEAMSKGGKVRGYFKPFITKLKIDTPEGGFVFEGEAYKAVGNLLNILLKDSEDKTLATKAPFKYEKSLDVDVVAALEKAIEHKISDNIKPGIDDSIGDKEIVFDKKLRQAQEEK